MSKTRNILCNRFAIGELICNCTQNQLQILYQLLPNIFWRFVTVAQTCSGSEKTAIDAKYLNAIKPILIYYWTFQQKQIFTTNRNEK